MHDNAKPSTEAPLPVTQRKMSFLATMKAVACSFLGIRSSSASGQDLATLNPLYIIGVAVLMVFLMVFGLIFLVGKVVAH